jgi:hypothetical protein
MHIDMSWRKPLGTPGRWEEWWTYTSIPSYFFMILVLNELSTRADLLLPTWVKKSEI